MDNVVVQGVPTKIAPQARGKWICVASQPGRKPVHRRTVSLVSSRVGWRRLRQDVDAVASSREATSKMANMDLHPTDFWQVAGRDERDSHRTFTASVTGSGGWTVWVLDRGYLGRHDY
jgi:hypothetical protein